MENIDTKLKDLKILFEKGDLKTDERRCPIVYIFYFP